MIDEDPAAREWLIAQGHRTAPQIYQNGQLFVEGGYQGLAKLSDEEFSHISEYKLGRTVKLFKILSI